MTGTQTRSEIIVVPHTHWDREWYEPFQRFRLRLVALLDDVFDRMAADPRQRFTLDGQMAAVDDYLEVRPHRREQIAALVRNGQLSVGPWQILLDEFLCSGENVVRNLERGLRRAEELGAALPVGYLPDMFGHIAQMPQILRLAGLEHACVFRGVPERMREHSFAWVAPDGTAIRTEYLPGGYGNAAGLVEAPGQIERRTADLAAFLSAWRPSANGGPMLAMYGSDHTAPDAALPDLLASTGVRLGTLAEYFAVQPSDVDGLRRIEGELRSHSRANILPGVISVRTHLKRAMGRAERTVERYAEPLAALWHHGGHSGAPGGDRAEPIGLRGGRGRDLPGPAPSLDGFLDMAWSRLIDCSCHDSVTGCGCDETAVQVAARLAEADQLGRAVCDLAGARLAAAVPRDGYAVFNPSPRTRTGLITVDVEHGDCLVTGDGVRLPVQALDQAPTLLADDEFTGADLPKALRRIHGTELYGLNITEWDLDPGRLTFHVARHGDPGFDVEDVRQALDGIDHSGPWRVRIEAAPLTTVAALVEVPALGHASVQPADGTAEVTDAVTVSEWTLDNGRIRVEVAEDGTLALTAGDVHVSGVGRIVDGGDVGDSYNYAPPATDTVIDQPTAVRVTTTVTGPLVGQLDIERDYAWPRRAYIDGGWRSADTVAVTVTTSVELRAHEPFVRLRTTFDNRHDDHRVRLQLPLPTPADRSYAEGQFAVVERGLTAEGGSGEYPLPTYPANGWVAAGGLAALLTQPTEYEVSADGSELGLTLLRSIGMLSRNRHALRDEPAGPQLPTPQAQCHGIQTFDVALLPFTGEWHEADVVTAAEDYRHEFLAFAGSADAGLPLATASLGVSVAGQGVVTTSVRPRDGMVEVRVVAQTPVETEAIVRAEGTRTGWLVDLRGRVLREVTAPETRLGLRPWEIATFRYTQ
jgi:alpha-mannosidase